jgi:hypothetical protein
LTEDAYIVLSGQMEAQMSDGLLLHHLSLPHAQAHAELFPRHSDLAAPSTCGAAGSPIATIDEGSLVGELSVYTS